MYFLVNNKHATCMLSIPVYIQNFLERFVKVAGGSLSPFSVLSAMYKPVIDLKGGSPTTKRE